MLLDRSTRRLHNHTIKVEFIKLLYKNTIVLVMKYIIETKGD